MDDDDDDNDDETDASDGYVNYPDVIIDVKLEAQKEQ